MEIFIPITLFLSVAAVAILRPLTTKLGCVLEAITQDRTRAKVESHENERVLALLEHISRRIDLMEERLDFTERLVSTGRPDHRRPLQRGPNTRLEAGLSAR